MPSTQLIAMPADTYLQPALSIILIEDDEDDYLITQDLLDEAYGKNYSLTWINSAKKAIERLNSDRFDVCLADYHLGNTTGIELIRLIQLEGQADDMAIILLTGTNSHDLDLLATEAGATDYLVKSELKADILERSIRYSRRQKESESKVRHMAFHDPLTELANRYLFTKHLERSISISGRHAEYGGLVFIDLDNFKSVNDNLGHSIGDKLLIEVGLRLKQCIRSEDIVARFGGDEFVLLFTRLAIEELAAFEQMKALVGKILDKLNEPVQITDHELRVSCSIGVTLFCNNEGSSETLLKQADMAMYKAKTDGKNSIRFFDSRMEASAEKLFWVQQELHSALKNNQFDLFYQPIVMLDENRITGAEALIRWRHPDHGMIMPADFIPAAENSNHVCEIGDFVITEACRYLNDSPALDYISINISARHFEDESFYDDFTAILDRMGTAPSRVVIELTESILLKDIQLARDKMTQLGNLGIKFALDDFGTGYSSLSVLRNLPIHILKIDRSFIIDIGSDPDCDAIVEAIIGMSVTLGLQVIAEGVETSEQLEFLNNHDCAKVQGYYFSKPVPAEEFVTLLKQGALESVAVK